MGSLSDAETHIEIVAAGQMQVALSLHADDLLKRVTLGFVDGWLLTFPLGFGAVGLWLGLAMGLAVVAIALGLRLQSRARLQIRAAETIDPQLGVPIA